MQLLMEEAHTFAIQDRKNGIRKSERYEAFWNLRSACRRNVSNAGGFNKRKHYGKFSLCFAQSNGLVDDNGMLQKQRVERLVNSSCIFTSEGERRYYLEQTRTLDGKWDNGFVRHCNTAEARRKMDKIGLLGAMRSKNLKKKLKTFMKTKTFKSLFPGFALCGLPKLRNCLWINRTAAIVGNRDRC